MKCISIVDARYVKDYQIVLKFNTGETGEVDLRDLVYKYPKAVLHLHQRILDYDESFPEFFQ